METVPEIIPPSSDAGCPKPITTFANITSTPIQWLWPGHIPRGKLTLLAGDPGAGKTFLALDIAARVSTGRPFPGQSTSPDLLLNRTPALISGADAAAPANVLLLTSRNDFADIVRPRLDAAGADSSRIFFTSAPTIQAVKHCLKNLDNTQSGRIGLIIFDPLTILIGVRSHRFAARNHVALRTRSYSPHSACRSSLPSDAAVPSPARIRPPSILAPWLRLARIRSVPILGLVPLRLGRALPLQRLPSGLPLLSEACSVFVVSRDHGQESSSPRRLLVHLKSNLAEPAPVHPFYIQDHAIHWSSETFDLENLDHALCTPRAAAGPDPVHLDRCARWLYDLLTPNPRLLDEVIAAARAAGFSRRTLYRAKPALNVRAKKNSHNQWLWKIESSSCDTLAQMQDRVINDDWEAM